MRERVRGYADAVLETSPAHVATMAGQLEGFSGILAASTELHWALTSPATPLPTRRAILKELLAHKVSAPVLELLSYALNNGGVDDFAEDVRGLAVAAQAKRDGMVLLDEGPLGRLSATERLEGYASAVLAPVHGERRLGDVEDELFRFMRIVEGDDDLRVALTTSELSSDVRSSIVRDLLTKRARPESARLAAYATRIGRPRDFPLLLDALVEMVAEETNRRVADVRSAIELTAAQRDKLATALSNFTGHAVDVRVTPEPQLLGGFVATIGDVVIDTSLRRRLEQASELLMQPPAQAPGHPSSEPGGERK
ncbi:MAG TPA: ATP synthase F1 subunit delta [Acidimicrobiales bacterium]|nr:ATP synthase F1 subunit delta [Acidimicrobiales bacterium]